MADSLVLEPERPLSPAFVDAIGRRLADFIEEQADVLAPIGAEVEPLHRLAADFTRGGKRLRPAFCVWGYVAAAGLPAEPEPLLAAAASLDLLHVSALVHDDVMDDSATRRGLPAAHLQVAAEHADRGWRGDAAAFGRGGAILLGDLLLMWSVELLHRSGLEPARLAAALPLIQRMRTEVTCGQFLDLVSQVQHSGATQAAAAIDEANRVVEFKSARYTVQRPSQFGAALGGASPALLASLAAFGSPLGRAFQFRDDVLGVFGDERVTGKPAGDDLREGKRTLLLAQAYALASPADAARLDRLVGHPELSGEGVEQARRIIRECGALAAVEAMIEAGHAEALAVLQAADVTDEGRAALAALAEAAVRRQA